MLEHHRLARYVDAYLDEELPVTLARRVGAHLRGCERCSRAAAVTVLIKRRLVGSRFTLMPFLARQSAVRSLPPRRNVRDR